MLDLKLDRAQAQLEELEQLESFRKNKITVDRKNRTLTFYSGCPLSNYYPAHIQIPVGDWKEFSSEEYEYESVEQAFQCARFDTSKYQDIIHRIKSTTSPAVAASMGLLNRDVSVEGWEHIQAYTMKMLVRMKMEQHPEIKNLLLNTIGWELYEDTPDTYGGPMDRVGESCSGEILMEIREELQNEKTNGGEQH